MDVNTKKNWNESNWYLLKGRK